MSKQDFRTNFGPSKTVQALQNAVKSLYCCEDFSVIGKLGSGFFANVYLVNHRPSKMNMALKISNEGNVQRREIEFLSILHHDNVQRLYGACIVAGRLACLSEYANGGSLVDLLTSSSAPLSWSSRMNIAHDIISGIGHLHEYQLVHRDLSSQNILIRVNHLSDWSPTDEGGRHHEGVLLMNDVAHLPVGCCGCSSSSAPSSPLLSSPSGSCGAVSEREDHSSYLHLSPRLPIKQLTTFSRTNSRRHSSVNRGPPNLYDIWTMETCQLPKVTPLVSMTGTSENGPVYTAIVCDLGVCLDLKDTSVDPTINTGNPFCTAPECLKKVAPYSTAADIFSFGLLLCEIITGLINNGYNLPRTSDFGLDVDQLPILLDCPPWLVQLVARCCNVNFRKRPNASEISALFLTKLEAVVTPVPVSPSPSFFVAKHALQPSPSNGNPKVLNSQDSDVSPPKRKSGLVSAGDLSEKANVEPSAQHPPSSARFVSNSPPCCTVPAQSHPPSPSPPPPPPPPPKEVVSKGGCFV